jgi:cell wall-associated NlpC family hydrolase
MTTKAKPRVKPKSKTKRKTKTKTVTLAQSTFKIGAGSGKTIQLHLGSKARALLRAAGRRGLAVTLIATAKDANGTRVRTTHSTGSSGSSHRLPGLADRSYACEEPRRCRQRERNSASLHAHTAEWLRRTAAAGGVRVRLGAQGPSVRSFAVPGRCRRSPASADDPASASSRPRAGYS